MLKQTDSPSHLVFVTRRFWPVTDSISKHLVQLSESLVAMGHRVSVIQRTTAFDAQLDNDEYRVSDSLSRSIEVITLNERTANLPGKLGRAFSALAYLLGAARALRRLRKQGRVDTIVSTAPTKLNGLCGQWLCWVALRRVPHARWVLDVDAEKQLQREGDRPSRATRIAAWAEYFSLRRADRLIAIGRCMRDLLIDHGCPETRVGVAPMWSIGTDFEPIDTRHSLRNEHPNWEGKFVVMYAGHGGDYHAFEAIRRAMLALRDDERFMFVFVGVGVEIDATERYAERHGLTAFARLPLVSGDRLYRMLAAADVHLVSLRGGMLGTCVPSKLFDVMAAERPSVFVGPEACESAQLIREHACGLVVDEDDADGFVQALHTLVTDDTRRRTLARNARRAAVERFGVQQGARRFMSALCNGNEAG